MISCVCSLSLQLESFNLVFVGNLTAQCSVHLTAASICTAALASAKRRPMKYLYANTVRFIVLLPAIWRQDRRWYTTRWSVAGGYRPTPHVVELASNVSEMIATPADCPGACRRTSSLPASYNQHSLLSVWVRTRPCVNVRELKHGLIFVKLALSAGHETSNSNTTVSETRDASLARKARVTIKSKNFSHYATDTRNCISSKLLLISLICNHRRLAVTAPQETKTEFSERKSIKPSPKWSKCQWCSQALDPQEKGPGLDLQ